MRHRTRRVVTVVTYLSSLALMVFVGWRYDDLSPGLASPTGDGPFFCAELLSGGGDDSAMVFAFGLFALPLAWRVLRLRQPAGAVDLALFGLALTVTLAALALASMDCANIVYTAFGVPDPALMAALFALPVAAGAFWTLWTFRNREPDTGPRR